MWQIYLNLIPKGQNRWWLRLYGLLVTGLALILSLLWSLPNMPTAQAALSGTLVGWGSNSSGQTSIPADLATAKAVAGGNAHTLALKADGTLVAWGNNSFGQTTLPTGLSGVKSIAAGGYHNLALKADGTLVAWGDNGSGQTTLPTGLSGVKAIAGGTYHSLALKADGTVVAWGDNTDGQTSVPTGLSGVKAIAAGNYHSLALKDNGTVIAWGRNSAAQATVPSGLSGVKAIAGGANHSLALKADGTLVAWGDNGSGQTTIPTGLNNVSAIAAGANHNLALKADGTVVAWGRNDRDQINIPSGLNGVTAIAAGSSSSFALKGAGSVIGWGNNYRGQSSIPAAARNGVKAVSAGEQHSLALKSDGTVVAWGDNGYGQVSVPPTLTQVIAISAGNYHSLALKADGTLVGWGYNVYGQASSPGGLNGVIALGSGSGHSLALKADGTVAAWGQNLTGEISVPTGLAGVTDIFGRNVNSIALKSNGTVAAWGYNGVGQTNVPSGLINVTAVDSGYFHSLAIKADGTVAAWGDNALGQLNMPSGLNSVVSLEGGSGHTVALKADGTVAAWGDNRLGQTNIPGDLTAATAAAAGYLHSLALTLKSPTVLSVSSIRVTYGTSPIVISATLTNYADGSPLVGKQLSFKLGGANLGTANTNSSGVAAAAVGVDGRDAGSYLGAIEVTFWGDNDNPAKTATADLIINKAELTVTADNKSREYGQPNPNLTVSYSGFVFSQNSSAVGGSPACSTTATVSSPVAGSPYPITCTIGTLTSPNYDFTSFVSGKLTVTKAIAVLRAFNPNGTYGGTTTLSTTLTTASGTPITNQSVVLQLNNKTVGVVKTNANGVAQVSDVSLSEINAGSYPGSFVTSFTDSSGNYGSSVASAQLTVNKLALSVTADSKTRLYGQPNPTFTTSYSGFITGDNNGVVSGSPACTTTATLTSTVGASPYPITCATGTLSATNYSFATPFTAGVLTVTVAPTSLTVSTTNGTSSGTATLSATLTSLGSPASGQIISFSLLGTPVGSATTDANGLAQLGNVSLSGIPVGTYANGITVSFVGDSNYTASSGTGSLSVGETACDYLLVNTSADDGCGSLRQAITYANSRIMTEPLTITLATSYITLTTALPVISNTSSNLLTIAGNCTVDATTGRGKPGTLIRFTPDVTINNAGLRLTNSTVVTGVAIAGFGGYGISISGDNNTVSCNWVGTADGQTANGNLSGGISINGNSNRLGIAGQAASGNLISGNGGAGVYLASGSNSNRSYYTWIGLNADGTSSTAMRNGQNALRFNGAKLLAGLGNRWQG